MKICISASIRFKDEILRVSEALDKMGIPHLLPEMDLPKELETPDMIPRLVRDHLAKIRESDAVLVVNPTGYFGNSVKVEIGYAKGLGKKIYFLEKTNEPEFDCLADGFVAIDELGVLL